MKATHYIAQFLKAQGVNHVFEMSGGMITHLLDSLSTTTDIKIVSVHHEQSAAFAADAMGRMTGVPGVALATSGPGATNLLTGIGSCHFDSSPAVFITGQVNRHEQKGDRPIRQLGFQETDIVAMAKPITKAAWLVQHPDEIPELLRRAFHVATEGRPGPVLLDIPMDCQRANLDVTAPPSAVADTPEPFVAPSGFWDDLFGRLASAKRPLILVGGGVRSARATDLLRQFVHLVRVPVVNSLMAVDVLAHSDPYRVGMIGSYGNRWGNLAIGASDLLLVLGSRLDIRQTGSETAAWKGDREIIHVDTEAGELNNRITGCETVLAHLQSFLQAAVAAATERVLPEHTAWLEELAGLRYRWPDTRELAGTPGINPNLFLHQLAVSQGEASAFVSDVGQHQMWSAQSLEIGPDQRFLTSGGMGSMGFALPAAIGAAFAVPGRPVVVVAGDGGFQSNIQELQTVVRNGLPIKIVILNNGCHGMVRQFQTSYFEGRLQSTLWGYSAPDFAAVAAAYGMASRSVSEESDVEASLAWLAADPTAPALLDVRIDTYADTYPKIAFGRPMTEMEPQAKPVEMEST